MYNDDNNRSDHNNDGDLDESQYHPVTRTCTASEKMHSNTTAAVDNNNNSINNAYYYGMTPEAATREFDVLRREATKLERHLEDRVARYQQVNRMSLFIALLHLFWEE